MGTKTSFLSVDQHWPQAPLAFFVHMLLCYEHASNTLQLVARQLILLLFLWRCCFPFKLCIAFLTRCYISCPRTPVYSRSPYQAKKDALNPWYDTGLQSNVLTQV